MARTALTVQSVVRSGITPSYTAAIVDGHSFVNSGGVILVHIKNTGGTLCTVTFQTPGKVKGETITARTVDVPATTGDKMVSPFPPDVFNQTDGAVYIDYSVQSGVTVAVFLLPS